MPNKATLEERQLLQQQGYSWRVLKFPARITFHKPDGRSFECISDQGNRLIYLRKGYRLEPFSPAEVAAYQARKKPLEEAPVQVERESLPAANLQITGAHSVEVALGSDVGEVYMPVSTHHHIYPKTGQHCNICGQVRQRAYQAKPRRYNKEA